MFGKRLVEIPESQCLELFFYVALFLHVEPENSIAFDFLNFVFSIQQGCWLCWVPPRSSETWKLPSAESWGEDYRTHLMIFILSGIIVLAPWCPLSVGSCFVYFVLFSGCL